MILLKYYRNFREKNVSENIKNSFDSKNEDFASCCVISVVIQKDQKAIHTSYAFQYALHSLFFQYFVGFFSIVWVSRGYSSV